jgi:tRNA A37 threonylcarbamoyltransferase TsaD
MQFVCHIWNIPPIAGLPAPGLKSTLRFGTKIAKQLAINDCLMLVQLQIISLMDMLAFGQLVQTLT